MMEADVEALRVQVRDALGQAVQDGCLNELMDEAASQPFAAKAELLVVKRKTPPLPKAKASVAPLEAWRGTSAVEAQPDPLKGEARLAKMRVSVDEGTALMEEAQHLDAMSIASHEDVKLAKARVCFGQPGNMPRASTEDDKMSGNHSPAELKDFHCRGQASPGVLMN
eukprot:Skav201897  [mRNA]  locus=scaffold550:954418:964453:- [translate_table: standard]